MKTLARCSAAIAALALSVTTVATAQQVLLAGDTYINSAAPANNYSNLATVGVSSTTPALLKFDLADVLPSGTTAAQVSNAKLILYLDDVTTTGSFNIYQVTSNWGEHSVTYNTKPPISGTKAGSASATGTGSYSAIDLSALVRTWITTPSSNFGIELQSVGATKFTFDSKENTATSHQAVLQLVLASGPAGPQGPTGPRGPQGAAGGGLATVSHDGNLTGDGTSASPLAFASSITTTGSVDGQGGVYGENQSTEFGIGVIGNDYSMDGGAGVAGYSYGNTGNGTGVIAEGITGIFASGDPIAGQFEGDLSISGTLYKSGGSFKIDHPLDPENKYLSHSFVESPDMMNIYNGNVTTDGSGYATVALPDWFDALNRDFRYQLTSIGQHSDVWVESEIANRVFTIKSEKPRVKVSWQVTGIRQDAWADAHRIPVEEEKSERERGHYIHPELFGHAGEPSVAQIQHPNQRVVRKP